MNDNDEMLEPHVANFQMYKKGLLITLLSPRKMRFFLACAIACLIFAGCEAKRGGKGKGKFSRDEPEQDLDMNEEEFEEHFQVFISDPKERAREAKALREAEKAIREQNNRFAKGESAFKEQLYPDSNLPVEEFEKIREGAIMPGESRATGMIMPPESERYDAASHEYFESLKLERQTLPTSYDSKDLGYITPVKDQGQCGSCVAFASNAALEACMLRSGGVTADFSEQEFVDCGFDEEKGAFGCEGAWPHAYLQWMKDNNVPNLPTESNYKYTATRGSCKTVSNYNPGARMYDMYFKYENTDNDLIKDLIMKHGAIVSSVNASPSQFRDYKAGIIDQQCSSTSTNHAIVLYGWGVQNGKEYWLGKNSWGTWWGENGLFKIGFNICGIGSNVIVPKCVQNGEADPTPAPPPPPPPADTCDMTSLYGQGLTGSNINLRTTINNVLYDVTVSCNAGICQMKDPVAGENACTKMCGRTSCDFSSSG